MYMGRTKLVDKITNIIETDGPQTAQEIMRKIRTAKQKNGRLMRYCPTKNQLAAILSRHFNAVGETTTRSTINHTFRVKVWDIRGM